MPWRGPQERGEYPTLGYVVGDWIEENLIVPDGPKMGEPYLLTDEMWQWVLRYYRLHPHAVEDMGSEAFVHYGGLLVRPQKWGKDPLAAAQICAHALGPTEFAGWDAAGEPVGRSHPSPWIQCVATAEDQTANTFNPLVTMLRDGPLADTPGLDVGETRVKLPGIGWIEPATSSGRARLGARLTFATFTESHLMIESNGGVLLAKNMKRNLSGMGGRWVEITNAWDPGEHSVAQRTASSAVPGVLVDYRRPRTRVDLEDEAAVKDEIRYIYGDSMASRGGWVREGRIIAEINDPATGENEARRYYLNSTESGTTDAIRAERWAALARLGALLEPGEKIALGFDGSRSRDATSLVACRISDGRLFPLHTWEWDGTPEWRVPRREVDQAVRDAMAGYQVGYLFADPYRWQDYLDAWERDFGDRIVEFPTTTERRMDAAIERVLTAVADDEDPLTHNGDETLARHVSNAVLAKGKKKPPRDDEGTGLPEYYMRVVKKKDGHWIDAFVAAILAYEARGRSIEDDPFVEEVEPWLEFL
ncbi:hypothetical protein [Nocardiopsis trehalosi]|uniref:hypothetical protein n=1 Tax=Nocardiopsis trehalosi TaxID=109329 RepID=UPI00082CF842|nr:hypothetical protein [Nocardiopsis trehalosi]